MDNFFQEIIKGGGHSSAIDWWALGKHPKDSIRRF